MKTSLQLLFLAFLLITNSSCLQKDPLFDGSCTSDCIVFLGKVTDPTGRPLSTEIRIKQRPTGFFAIEQLLGETETDEEGDFIFRLDGTNYKEDNDRIFTVSAHKTGYISDKNEGGVSFYNIDSTTFDIPTIANIVLNPISIVELDIKIASPADITLFYYNLSYLNQTVRNNIPNEEISTFHNFSETVGGEQTVLLKYSYRKSGASLEFEESFFMEGGKTKKIEIDVN